jgi:RNA recognition motif-containing protein
MDIYIGNLDLGLEEDSLKVLFKVFGEVESVKIIRDRETGKSKGFAFVNMLNSIEAQRAMVELHNIEIAGRRLVVHEAVKRTFPVEEKQKTAEQPIDRYPKDRDENISFKIPKEQVDNPLEYNKALSDDGFVRIKFKS